MKEALARKAERRREERRDSPRVPMRLWYRDPSEGGVFRVHEGDVSVEGAFWPTRYPPLGRTVELRFRIPGQDDEVCTEAEVVRTTRNGDDTGVHVRFTDLSASAQLALARHVDAAQ